MIAEKKYYWVDLESGETFECSREYWESMIKIWEEFKPKLLKAKEPIGSIFMTGSQEQSYRDFVNGHGSYTRRMTFDEILEMYGEALTEENRKRLNQNKDENN